MDTAYWLRRKGASLEAAQKAAGPEARLAHYDLAGRYSVKAASAKAAVREEHPPIALPEELTQNTDV